MLNSVLNSGLHLKVVDGLLAVGALNRWWTRSGTQSGVTVTNR